MDCVLQSEFEFVHCSLASTCSGATSLLLVVVFVDDDVLLVDDVDVLVLVTPV